MRRLRTSGISPSLPIAPASAAFWMGDSGGMYHTIGSVRYSGCSGKATFHSIAIFQIGLSCAALIQSSGMPSARAVSITTGSLGSRNTSSCAS